MTLDIQSLRQRRIELLGLARGIAAQAMTARRALTPEERTQYDAHMAEAETLKGDITRAEALEAELRAAGEPTQEANRPPMPQARSTPADRNNDGRAAFFHYLRTGQRNSELRMGMPGGEFRASNDTDLNITTAADGGALVPTGFYNGIIGKRNESMLAPRIGVLQIPGTGTTVDVPIDNGTANEFVATSETVANDRDAPAFDKVSMTLVVYTKKVQMSLQLLRDEDARLETFLTNYIGRAMARTHNKLLVTALLSGGTTNALGAAAAATVTDIPKLVYALKSEYADQAVWIMKRATEGAYFTLVGSNFQLTDTPQGNAAARRFWNYPVFNSEYVEAVATTKKSLIFGNMEFCGMREDPSLTILRDPYSSAANGQINLHCYFSTVYSVLQAEAIQYGTHP